MTPMEGRRLARWLFMGLVVGGVFAWFEGWCQTEPLPEASPPSSPQPEEKRPSESELPPPSEEPVEKPAEKPAEKPPEKPSPSSRRELKSPIPPERPRETAPKPVEKSLPATPMIKPPFPPAPIEEQKPSATPIPKRPATWTEALWKVKESLETRFFSADYWGFFLEVLNVLRGSRLMREYLDNQQYLQWTLFSVGLLLLGQATLFAYMGTPIRRMAVLLPRRPLGPILLGIVGVGVSVPVSVGLIYSFVGIPFAVALWAFLYAAALIGKMGLFLSMGWGISRAFGGQGSSVVPFFVVYVIYAALVILDPFSTGRIFFVTANLVGIGLALRTRFGINVYPRESSSPKKSPSSSEMHRT